MDTLLGSSTSEVRLRRNRRRRRQKISSSSIDLSSLIKFHHFLSESVAFHSHERVSVPRPILTDLDDVFSRKHFRFTIPEIREISGLLGLSAFIDVPHTGMRLEGWRCLTVLSCYTNCPERIRITMLAFSFPTIPLRFQKLQGLSYVN
jgi:hypothetical protein